MPDGADCAQGDTEGFWPCVGDDCPSPDGKCDASYNSRMSTNECGAACTRCNDASSPYNTFYKCPENTCNCNDYTSDDPTNECGEHCKVCRIAGDINYGKYKCKPVPADGCPNPCKDCTLTEAQAQAKMASDPCMECEPCSNLNCTGAQQAKWHCSENRVCKQCRAEGYNKDKNSSEYITSQQTCSRMQCEECPYNDGGDAWYKCSECSGEYTQNFNNLTPQQKANHCYENQTCGCFMGCDSCFGYEYTMQDCINANYDSAKNPCPTTGKRGTVYETCCNKCNGHIYTTDLSKTSDGWSCTECPNSCDTGGSKWSCSCKTGYHPEGGNCVLNRCTSGVAENTCNTANGYTFEPNNSSFINTSGNTVRCGTCKKDDTCPTGYVEQTTTKTVNTCNFKYVDISLEPYGYNGQIPDWSGSNTEQTLYTYNYIEDSNIDDGLKLIAFVVKGPDGRGSNDFPTSEIMRNIGMNAYQKYDRGYFETIPETSYGIFYRHDSVASGFESTKSKYGNNKEFELFIYESGKTFSGSDITDIGGNVYRCHKPYDSGKYYATCEFSGGNGTAYIVRMSMDAIPTRDCYDTVEEVTCVEEETCPIDSIVVNSGDGIYVNLIDGQTYGGLGDWCNENSVEIFTGTSNRGNDCYGCECSDGYYLYDGYCISKHERFYYTGTGPVYVSTIDDYYSDIEITTRCILFDDNNHDGTYSYGIDTHHNEGDVITHINQNICQDVCGTDIGLSGGIGYTCIGSVKQIKVTCSDGTILTLLPDIHQSDTCPDGRTIEAEFY